MSVILITVTESDKQTVEGIPNYINVITNIPSTIFYTLDGSDPDEYSDIYLSSIKLPTDRPSVTLKLYATNGVDNSDIMTMFYSPKLPPLRTAHSTVDMLSNSCCDSTPKYILDTNSKSSLLINEYGEPAVNVGYDADGYIVPQTTKEIPLANLPYSNYNFRGETVPPVGYRPTKTKFIYEETAPKYVNKEDVLFNPKALVIFQDVDKDTDPLSPTLINRTTFSSENTEKVRDGNLLYNAALDSPTHTGSYIRREFNPKTQKLTYYYYDNTTNRWIISSHTYQQKEETPFTMANIYFGRNNGAGVVFKWLPVKRTLF